MANYGPLLVLAAAWAAGSYLETKAPGPTWPKVLHPALDPALNMDIRTWENPYASQPAAPAANAFDGKGGATPCGWPPKRGEDRCWESEFASGEYQTGAGNMPWMQDVAAPEDDEAAQEQTGEEGA